MSFRSVDPFGEAVERPTSMLGTLWATGGLLALLWAVAGVVDGGSSGAVALLGGFALALGSLLLALRTRLLSANAYTALTLLGSGVICAIVWWSGWVATAAPAILFVYVGVFACVALGSAAWAVLPISAALHAATLVLRGPETWWGEWVMIWGATLVASVLMGAAVAANRRSTAERVRLLEDLRSADETKTAFLYALGHDLSTPAANVAGLARTVLSHDEHVSAEQRRSLLERLEANATRLHGDLIALLRLEELGTGRLEVTREPLWLAEVVDRATRRAGLSPDRIEQASLDGIRVDADATKLEHALANLLTNAQKYGPADGRIVVRATQEAERTVIHVDDDGPGVPEAQHDRIFEPLVRARVADIEHGSGIGLSVVRAFARFHGGDSWVEDAPGGGARFCVALPRAAGPVGR